jgi:hypothetical protein
LYAALGGTAGISVDYDPTAGKPLGVNPQTGKPFGTGDVRVSVSSMGEMVWEGGVRDPETATWWIKATALPPREIQRIYGLKKEPKGGYGGMESIFSGDPTRHLNDDNTELSLVLTYYERPTGKGRGQVITTTADSEVIQEQEWPFPFTDRLNVAVMRESLMPGRWAGDTVVSDAIPLQIAYNHSLSFLVEHVKLMGNARLLIPRSQLDVIEELTDEPGQLLPYNDGSDRPSYLTPQSMPNFVMDLPDRLKDQIDRVLGLPDVLRGSAPPNLESGLALQILTENADTPIERLSAEGAKAWSKVGQMNLEIYQAEVGPEEQRKARVDIPNAPAREIIWSGGDLLDQVNCVVPFDAVAPRSRAGQEALALQMWDKGIIKDPKLLSQVAMMNETEQLISRMNPDVERAERENYDMADGTPRAPADYDDHAEHISCHNDFRKSATYEALEPQYKKMVDSHILSHEEMALNEAQSQMMNPMFAGIPQADEPMGSMTNPLPEGMGMGGPPPMGGPMEGLGPEMGAPEMGAPDMMGPEVEG